MKIKWYPTPLDEFPMLLKYTITLGCVGRVSIKKGGRHFSSMPVRKGKFTRDDVIHDGTEGIHITVYRRFVRDSH